MHYPQRKRIKHTFKNFLLKMRGRLSWKYLAKHETKQIWAHVCVFQPIALLPFLCFINFFPTDFWELRSQITLGYKPGSQARGPSSNPGDQGKEEKLLQCKVKMFLNQSHFHCTHPRSLRCYRTGSPCYPDWRGSSCSNCLFLNTRS